METDSGKYVKTGDVYFYQVLMSQVSLGFNLLLNVSLTSLLSTFPKIHMLRHS